MNKMDELLGIAETAQILEVSVDTVRRAEKAGKIRAIRTLGGQRRFRRSEVEALATELGNLSGDNGAA